MKKTILIIAFALCILPCFCIKAFAFEDYQTESIADEVGIDKLDNEYLSKDELSGDKSVNVFEKTFSIIKDSIRDNGFSVIKSFGGVFAVVLLSCVMGAMKFSKSETLDKVCSYISLLVLAGITYNLLYKLFVYITAVMETLTTAVGTLMPIMASLYVFGGNAAAGAASSSGLLLLLSVISLICTKVILPLLQISFALCLVGAIPGSINLCSATNLIKNTTTTIMAFVFSLLGFALYLQTTVASASDTFVTRSVRFASGVIVPVIGNMLGDASRTVMASVSVIKGTVGIAGVVIILSIVVPPIIVVLLNKLMLLLCGIISKSLNCDTESRFLYDLIGILNVLLALTVGAGVVCIIAFAVFVRVSV